MKKRPIAFCVAIVAILGLVIGQGCAASTASSSGSGKCFKVLHRENSPWIGSVIFLIEDTATGQQYLYIDEGSGGGLTAVPR